MELAKKKFADCVAPGRSEKLLEMMEEGESSDENKVSDDLARAAEIYRNTDDERAKLVIISLQNHYKYSRECLK